MTQVDWFPIFTEIFGPQCIEKSDPPHDIRFENDDSISGNLITGKWQVIEPNGKERIEVGDKAIGLYGGSLKEVTEALKKQNGSKDWREALARQIIAEGEAEEAEEEAANQFMLDCHAQGMNYDEVRAALLADKNKAGEWATPLNRAIGRLVLIAACRRARQPGCKFDNITVLEGNEGTNKSTAIRVLAGDENFSDQSILGASDKEVQEQLDGIWMHENADLAGMVRAEVERVKAFASRQTDRARPAYGHVREDRPRRSIEWGTTNNDEYLLAQTGNCRFWPLKTGKININAIIRDREQLLGEAATYEAANETITLSEKLWPDARDAQEQRRVTDPWEDLLANIPDRVDISKDETTDFVTIVHRSNDGSERVASADLLTYVLNVQKAQQSSFHSQRLAHAMKRLGWTRNPSGQVTINGVSVRRYIRNGPTENIAEDPPWA